MLILRRRVALALWAATLFGAGSASAQPAPEDATRVATAALGTLAETLIPVSGLEFRTAEFTVASPELIGPSDGQAEAHVLRFPDVRVADGSRLLSAASVDLIVLRLSEDLYEVRVQLPSLMDQLRGQVYIGTLTIGERTIRGVWSDSLRMFVELEVSLSGIRIAELPCDAACDARLGDLDLSVIIPDAAGTHAFPELTIGSFDWHHGLTEQEAGLWSGLAGLAVEDVVWSADEDWAARSIGQISLEADIRSADLSGFRDLADQMPDPDTPRPLDALTVSRLLATTPPLLDGGSVAMRVSSLVIEPAAAPEAHGAEVTADPEAPPRGTVDRFGGRIAIDGLTGEESQMQVSLAYSVAGPTDRQNARWADLMPETLSMAVGVDRIPSEYAWQEIQHKFIAPLLFSRREIELAAVASLISLGATPEARWSIGPVQADYADWSLGGEGTMALTGPPLWEVTGELDLMLRNIDQPLARLPDHSNPWLRERGLPILRALRDIALPGAEPDTLTVQVAVPEHGRVYLNGHELSNILE